MAPTRAGRPSVPRWWRSRRARRTRWWQSWINSDSRCRGWQRASRASPVMTLRERIGVDLGGRRRLGDGPAWAAAHGVHYVDACLEGAPDHPNAPATWTADRVAAIRATCERHRIQLGLHSASAVNVAETSPLLADAADQYLRIYIELAGRLSAGWIVVHGGYHFTGDYAARRAASLERLQRAAALAERSGAQLLLENLNREPEHAEVRYLAHNLQECHAYFGRIQAPR